MITGDQVKAVRKLFGWAQIDLGLRARLSDTSVMRFETGKGLSGENVRAIKEALEVAGVEFVEGETPGVRLGK